MNDQLCTSQCLDKIVNAVCVVNLMKQQQLNAVPVSSGSPTAVPGCQQVTIFVELNQYPFTSVNACQLAGIRQLALKTQPNVTTCHSQSGSKRKKTIHVQNVIGPFTCPA